MGPPREDEREQERLRRLLRAQAAVNRELAARLEDGGEVSGIRRAGVGGEWLDRLSSGEPVEATLVRAPDGSPFVLEGRRRRRVGSEVLFGALVQALGEPAVVSEAAWAETDVGVPVELLEAQSGRPFVVVGGRRLPIRGVPIPHPVSAGDAEAFPLGEALDVEAVGRVGVVDEIRDLGARVVGRAREAVVRRRDAGAASDPEGER